LIGCLTQVSPTEVCDPSRVKVFGPAVERSVSVDEPTYFVVDCSDAGPGTSYRQPIFLLPDL